MKSYLLVAFGSALGGMLRFWLSDRASRAIAVILRQGDAPFLGTLVVNVSGSFLIGFLAACAPGADLRYLLMVGVLGGYTTFSAFSLQTLQLAHEGRWAQAAASVVLSVTLSLAAVWGGHALALLLRRG